MLGPSLLVNHIYTHRHSCFFISCNCKAISALKYFLFWSNKQWKRMEERKLSSALHYEMSRKVNNKMVARMEGVLLLYVCTGWWCLWYFSTCQSICEQSALGD